MSYIDMTDKEILKLASNNHQEAFDFLLSWHITANKIDDIIDADVKMTQTERAKTIIDLCHLLYCPYFVRHAIQLWPVFSKLSSDYLLSVENEGKEDPEAHFIYDSLRQACMDLTLVVTQLENNNFEILMQVNRLLRSITYKHDH